MQARPFAGAFTLLLIVMAVVITVACWGLGRRDSANTSSHYHPQNPATMQLPETTLSSMWSDESHEPTAAPNAAAVAIASTSLDAFPEILDQCPWESAKGTGDEESLGGLSWWWSEVSSSPALHELTLVTRSLSESVIDHSFALMMAVSGAGQFEPSPLCETRECRDLELAVMGAEAKAMASRPLAQSLEKRSTSFSDRPGEAASLKNHQQSTNVPSGEANKATDQHSKALADAEAVPPMALRDELRLAFTKIAGLEEENELRQRRLLNVSAFWRPFQWIGWGLNAAAPSELLHGSCVCPHNHQSPPDAEITSPKRTPLDSATSPNPINTYSMITHAPLALWCSMQEVGVLALRASLCWVTPYECLRWVLTALYFGLFFGPVIARLWYVWFLSSQGFAPKRLGPFVEF